MSKLVLCVQIVNVPCIGLSNIVIKPVIIIIIAVVVVVVISRVCRAKNIWSAVTPQFR